MNWLLKIVEGPMKGAEVALVNGMRVKVGSSPDCDIVVADASLGDVAFELDVSETGVSCIGPDGAPAAMTPFEIRDFGTSAFALGPAEGAWKELTRPAPSAEAPAPESAPAEPPSAAETSAAEASAESAPAEAAPEAGEEGAASRRRRGGGCLLVIVILLLLALACWLLGRYCPAARPWIEKASPALAWTKDRCVRGWNWCLSACGGSSAGGSSARAEQTPRLSLGEIAAQHGLELGKMDDGAPRLVGNLRRRTERLAIRALALASDERVVFDLTDDETMRNSADELLFACTDGALKAVAASNRVVTVNGYAPSPVALEKAVRALNADVKGIDRLDTADVIVGGTPPKPLAATRFVREGGAAPAPAEAEAAKRPAAPRRDYPIAGILTAPYPCVVMRDGMRLIEGATIGTAVLERIEADRLTLREGKRTFEWKP